MDYRIPLGSAALALLLLPLGWQLYSSTAMTPPLIPREHTVTPQLTVEPKKQEPLAITNEQQIPDEERDRSQMAQTGKETEVFKDVASTTTPVDKPAQQPTGGLAATTDGYAMPKTDGTLAMGGDDADLSIVPGDMLAGRVDNAAPVAPMTVAESGAMSMEQPMMTMDTMVASEPEVIYRDTYDPLQPGDEFTAFKESPLKVVKDEPVSTFSIDVDTASYSYMRRMIHDGYLPQPDSVRIEEMVNYFPYDYPSAETSAQPFKPTMSIYPTPWNPKTQLLHIGIKGYTPPATEDKPSNLVFLMDTSGSMDEPDKLPLLKRAFELLVDQMTANDTISIVAYAGSAGVVLEPTKATEKMKIMAALENLYAGGSTAGAEGIELAYKLAEQNKIPDGNNRVILATDGDFNVGISDPEQLVDFIKEKRKTGVFLSVLGFGQGNLDDATMQALAQNGNGNAAYIDSFKEAQKVLVEEVGSTLETIAKDVKIQIEFNPAFVSEYRLVGYETRALNREDFNNDKVDAGDIGAGHTVTAIYEIVPAGTSAQFDPLHFGDTTATETPPAQVGNEIAFLKVRYKAPDSDTSQLIETPVTTDLVLDNIAQASDDVRFAAAVAAFGQKLKDSNYVTMSWDDIRILANGARGVDEDGYRAEFVQLVKEAASL